ncbi:uncharacterized protein si:dkey-229e3.2 [Danio rerio]|uniref:Si:dkey-229e3.2 n=1 Tax=Danio rerio TaxID=7955 RepID=X1WD82_DANRE|nr:uncharacterized protein si:dkey-229e3.2 [Danio rerio]|eukprot:XP_706061.1 uncharacterized protein si:dkey-229e3.2 [Danio rerio]
MGECVLDRYEEDGFQSCEGFDNWASFSSADWTETQKNNNEFSDWAGFHDNTGKEDFSTMPLAETGTFSRHENADNGDEVNPWFVFNNCFQVEKAEKDPVVMEIPTLSLLPEHTTDMLSQSAAITSEAASFWCHLQSGSKMLRLSGPKPKLHSQEALLKTLQLRQPDANTHAQTNTLRDLELEVQEDRPGALIQTKLMPSSNCRNAPGFFYQVSRHWLNMNLNKHNNDPLQ